MVEKKNFLLKNWFDQNLFMCTCNNMYSRFIAFIGYRYGDRLWKKCKAMLRKSILRPYRTYFIYSFSSILYFRFCGKNRNWLTCFSDLFWFYSDLRHLYSSYCSARRSVTWLSFSLSCHPSLSFIVPSGSWGSNNLAKPTPLQIHDWFEFRVFLLYCYNKLKNLDYPTIYP